MKDLIVLDPNSKSVRAWRPPQNFSYLAPYPALPAQAAEAGNLAAALPLALCKDAKQSSSWAMVALCGRGDGGNELISESGEWKAAAAPRCLAYLPFALRPVGGSKALAAIDPAYAHDLLVGEGDGVPLYDENGRLHPLAKRRVEILLEQQQRLTKTQSLLLQLKQAGLIMPWSDRLLAGGEISMKGLHTIDEKKLSQLDDETFLSLRKSGALALAYSCLLSLYQVRNLVSKGGAGKPVSDKAVQTTGDLDLEFLKDDDTIKFGPLN